MIRSNSTKDEVVLEINGELRGILEVQGLGQLRLLDCILVSTLKLLSNVAITNSTERTLRKIDLNSSTRRATKERSLKGKASDVLLARGLEDSVSDIEEGIENQVVLELLDEESVPINVAIEESVGSTVHDDAVSSAPGVDASEKVGSSVDLNTILGPEEDVINEVVIITVDDDTSAGGGGGVRGSVLVVVLSEPALVNHGLVASVDVDTSISVADEEDIGTNIATHGSTDVETSLSNDVGIKIHVAEADMLVAGLLLVAAALGTDGDQVFVRREAVHGTKSTAHHLEVSVHLREGEGLAEEVLAALEVDGGAAAVVDGIGHGEVLAKSEKFGDDLGEGLVAVFLSSRISAVVDWEEDGAGGVGGWSAQSACTILREGLFVVVIRGRHFLLFSAEVVSGGDNDNNKKHKKEGLEGHFRKKKNEKW